MSQQDFFNYLDSFEKQNQFLLKKFWKRISFHGSVRQRDVMDFGSGTGCLSIDLAKMGASKVVGVDCNKDLVEYSKYRISKNENVKSNLTFSDQEIGNFQSESFDFVFSKDTFEHLKDPDFFLNEFYRILKSGGELILGFGPLWHSPFGDHQLVKESFGFTLPWLHLFLGEENLKRIFNVSSLKKENPFTRRSIDQLDDYLNMYSIDFYKSLIVNSAFEVIDYQENIHENFYLNLFSKIRVPSFARKYWIRNLYCRLRKV